MFPERDRGALCSRRSVAIAPRQGLFGAHNLYSRVPSKTPAATSLESTS